MGDAIRVFSGRVFSSEEIELIKWTSKTYRSLSRSELANTICELIGWMTPSGKTKETQCMAFLKELEREGDIQLPSLRGPARKGYKVRIPELEIKAEEIRGEVGEYEPIKLEIARSGQCLKRWKAYVNQYHMLGYRKVFGSQLQYFVKSGEIELGCIQFSASAWSLEARDKWIGWTVDDRKVRLHLIVNNSRFLIFPWVHIRNLASRALSLAANRIQGDWLREYCYAPVLLETFVDLEHFKATCYKAANWIYLGETKGRGRMDRYNENALSRKAILVYPLQKDFRACLKGEKPYKVVVCE